jgi:Coenzyme PQQ synthesis protein D (PqqD)
MDNSTPIRKNPQVAFRSLVGEGGVLLHLESGQYHGLNEIGELIWELLDEEKTFETLVADVRERLVDPPDDLSLEVERFLNDLRERDLLAS